MAKAAATGLSDRWVLAAVVGELGYCSVLKLVLLKRESSILRYDCLFMALVGHNETPAAEWPPALAPPPDGAAVAVVVDDVAASADVAAADGAVTTSSSSVESKEIEWMTGIS